MSNAFDAALGKRVDELGRGLVRRPLRVSVGTEVGVAIVRLGVDLRPVGHFVRVDEDFIALDEGLEPGQGFVVAVLGHPGIDPVIPVMHAADQILAANKAVGEKGPAVKAATVENGDVTV